MPQVRDLRILQKNLETDRPWAAYALADLEPPYVDHTAWFCTDEPPATFLVYRAFQTPVIVYVGPSDCCAPLLDEVEGALGDAAEVYLVARPEMWPLVILRYRAVDERPMLRMVLDPGAQVAAPHGGVRRLGPDDLGAIQALYADEPPDFFLPAMLGEGVYFGLEEGGHLTAVAGTHVVAPTVGVAAIGNVYTRRDRRGRGHSTRVTSAVTAQLRTDGLRTVVLNVHRDNAAAIRVYEKLGYRKYCSYFPGLRYRSQVSCGFPKL